MSEKRVLILMGSDSDLSVMNSTGEALDKFGIGYEMHIASAHRTPAKVMNLAGKARENGFGIIITGAGMAAHLGGVVAAHTTLPVVSVPLAAGSLQGMDALLATVQMPRGIPVGTMGIGASGAYNAGLLAAAILSVNDDTLAGQLDGFRKELAKKVEDKDGALQRGS